MALNEWLGTETLQEQDRAKSSQQGVKGESEPVRKTAKEDEPGQQGREASATRQQKVLFGIPQLGLTEINRTVPANEPPPLPANKDLTYIGHATPRYDGHAKVTGAGRYTADVALPGMLFASMVTATVPHAKVKAIDTSAAEKSAGVRAIHVIEHVLGNSELRDPSKEMPSRYPIVRYSGQPIAAVAATSQAAAEDAARKVKVDYEAFDFVVDRDAARKSDSPKVYPGAADQAATAGGGGGPKNVPQTGNVHGPVLKNRGSIDDGLAAAEVLVEGEYETQVQTHSALETHGVVADWKPDLLTVYASTQGTSTVREELAEVFKLPKNRIRVITEFMGGGFGAKFGAGNEGVVAAALSRKANAPVRLMLSRRQEHIVSNRPDSIQQLKIGAKKDGTLTAIKLISYGTAGVGTGAGTAGPAANMYNCPNLQTAESDVFTNGGPGAAFRAPGHPQGCFALEQAIDELAGKLALDPLEYREQIDDNPARKVERQMIRERTNWKNRRPAGSDSGPLKSGMGIAQSVWYRFNNLDSACEVKLHRDGSLELNSAVQDIGSGIKTVLAQIVAEEFGIPPQQVQIHIGDTQYPPGPPSGGSMTTASITPAARNAAYRLKQKLFTAIAPKFGVQPANLSMSGGRVVQKDSSRSWTLKQAAAKLSSDEIAARAQRTEDYAKSSKPLIYGGVDYVELTVDTETGRVHIDKVFAAHDCGRPMNPLGVISQINGGILQGISYALFEQRVMDEKSGHMLNANLESYKIIGAREVPEIEVALVENYIGQTSTDAAGIGESAGIITLAAAIGNAFYNATSVRMRRIPMTPANVLEAVGAKSKEARA